MSKDELTQIANAETPPEVTIPNTWQGLIVWACARFGVGILVAAAFGYSTVTVYEDLREDRRSLMEAYQENGKALQDVAARMEEMTKSIDEAHRRATAGR